MTTSAIRIKNATLTHGKTTVFSNINMTIAPGSWTALLGKSGVGKSSLLRQIAGLTDPSANISGLFYTDDGSSLSQQVTYMAQTDLLLPWLTVLDNTLLSIKLRPHSGKDYQAAIARAVSLLEQVGLGNRLQAYPHELSGGMRQRTALIRTLMQDKPLVLMDEPFSALDAITRYQLQALAVTLLTDKTVIFVTHDPSEALRLAQDIYVMRPKQLKHVARLTTATPRELTASDVSSLHTVLIQELTHEEQTV